MIGFAFVVGTCTVPNQGHNFAFSAKTHFHTKTTSKQVYSTQLQTQSYVQFWDWFRFSLSDFGSVQI